MWVVVAENALQNGCLEWSYRNPLLSPREQGFFGILKDVLHHGEDAATDDKVQMATVLISVPLVLDLTEHCRIDAIEILKLVHNNRKRLIFRQLEQITEEIGYRGKMAYRNAQLIFRLPCKILAQQTLCFPRHKEIQYPCVATPLGKLRFTYTASPHEHRHSRLLTALLYYLR